MASLFRAEAPGAVESAFVTGDLDALANGSLAFGSGAAAVIDNTSTLKPFMDVLIKLGSTVPVAPGTVNIYLLASADGTTYQDPQTAIQPVFGVPKYGIGVHLITGAKTLVIRGITLAGFKYKMLFENLTGGPLATGGNSVGYYRYGYNLNG